MIVGDSPLKLAAGAGPDHAAASAPLSVRFESREHGNGWSDYLEKIMSGNSRLDDYMDRTKKIEVEIADLQQLRAQLMTSKWWLIFAGSTIVLLLGLFFAVTGLFDIDSKIEQAITKAGVKGKIDQVDEILKRALVETATSAVWVQYDAGRNGIQDNHGVKQVTEEVVGGRYVVTFEKPFQSSRYAAMAYTASENASVRFFQQETDRVLVVCENTDAFSLVFLGHVAPATNEPTKRNPTKP